MSVSFRPRGGLPVVALLSAIALAACGSSAAAPGRVPPSVAAQMHASLTQVGRGVRGGDRSRALGALTAFATDVARQRAAGHLTAADYAGLETGIARVRRTIAPAPTAPAATTTATTPAATTTATTPAATTSTAPAATTSTTPAATTTTTTTATPTAPVAPSPSPGRPNPAPASGHGHGTGNGHGTGKGHGESTGNGNGKRNGGH